MLWRVYQSYCQSYKEPNSRNLIKILNLVVIDSYNMINHLSPTEEYEHMKKLENIDRSFFYFVPNILFLIVFK